MMKKSIFKRILCFMLSLVMVLTMSSIQNVGQVIAKAAETTYTLYFQLPSGTTCADWCVNAWGNNVTVTGSDTKISPSGWTDGKEYPTLLSDDKEDWGYVEVTGTISGLQFVKEDGTAYKCWNARIAKELINPAYFVPGENDTGVWYSSSDCGDDKVIKDLELRNLFYLKGSLEGTDWDETSTKGKMTVSADNENVYSVTFSNVKKGNYEFKILQDPENWGWDKYFGKHDPSTNQKVTVKKACDVTFTIDITDENKECKVTYSVDQDSADSDEESSLKASDEVVLKVDEESYDMNMYYGGVYEVPVALTSGDHTAQVILNGTEQGTAKSVTVGSDATVYFRFTEGELTDSVNDAETVRVATFVGDFTGVEFNNKIANWTPADTNGDLDYIGGGLYSKTFNFVELASDTDIQYKVAFEHAWDYSIGADGGSENVKLTIPAGSTEITILVDEINKKLYDSISTPELLSRVTLAGSMNGWGDSVKNPENDFRPISDTIYVYQKRLAINDYEYKCIFDGDRDNWLGGDNKAFKVEKDNTLVTFVYDKESKNLYDSINDLDKVNILVGLASAPAEMKTVTNANGTTKFIATGNKGQKVTLSYANKADVEKNGDSAFTTVDLGAIKKDSVSSEDIFFGDEAVDVVYYYEIDGARTLDTSNETVTIGSTDYSNYKRDKFEGRKVYVPGTFPGNSWDPASNLMTYKGNGLYAYTFKDVAPQNYQYKIAMGKWTENYGVSGAADGSNYSVTVPSKQDVTVYYQDIKTHLSVTSLNYKFVKASVSGTGVTETELKDDGLTGIYSATVHMAAKTYDDVKLTTEEDGKTEEKKFDQFEIKIEKDVTFYYAPQYGIYYNDATEWECDDDQIKYDTKNTANKSVYGAVATGEDVTFTVDTDDNVTAVKLFVKLNDTKAYDLKKVEGENKFSATVQFDSIGEYEYFFVIYSGSAVKVYCDDEAQDYGVGTLSDLTSVTPYDLVVYKSGYKTPDWMKNAVIYQIFPDRFNNGSGSNDDAQTSARGESDYELVDWSFYPENPEQEDLLTAEEYAKANGFDGDRVWNNEIYGGDFKGIVDRIDYLKALGVNVIYLNPVFSSISSHRYDATDYGVMDPILGGDGDFEELVQVAKENGMKIVLDGVFNHVSDDSIYFDRYYKFLTASDFDGKMGAYPYWAYVYDYMSENNASKETAEDAAKQYFTENYNVTDFSYTTWFDVYTTTMKDDNGDTVKDNIGLRSGKPVYGYEGWWGYDSMPVIKATNGSEYQTTDWAKEIIGNSEKNNGSIAQYWLSKGSNGWRLDVANEVSDETWQHFRESVKAMGSDNVIIGEIWDDATEYLLGDMYDSVMNYVFRGAVLSYAKGGNASDSMATLEKLRERYPKEAFYAMMNLVDSHDTTRVLSYLDGIDDDRNQKDVDSAFPTYEKTSESAKQKQYLVALLQFTYAGAPTIYYGDEIGMVGADDPDDRRAFEWGQGNEALVKYYAKLANIRNNYSVLRTGEVDAISTGNEKVLGFVRSDAEDAIGILTNNSKAAIKYTLDITGTKLTEGTYTDLISGNTFVAADGKLEVTIPANSGLILTKNVKSISVNEAALVPAFDSAYALKSDIGAAGLKATITDNSYVYDGTAKTQQVSDVSYRGKKLTEGTDYDVTYENNTNAGTAVVKINGNGRYTGTATKEFTIAKAAKTINVANTTINKNIGDAAFSLGANTATGETLNYTSSNNSVVTVDAIGNVTIAGAGTATVTVSSPESTNFSAAANVVVTINVSTGNQPTTPTPGVQQPEKKATKTIKVSKKSYTKVYGNKAFGLGAKTAAGEILKYSSSNKKVVTVSKTGKVTIKGIGTATITITSPASAKYKAAKAVKVTIKVVPKRVKFSSVKNIKGGKLRIAWRKDKTVTGYEVLYSTKANFKNAKKVTVKSYKTVSVKTKKLTKNKTYYVKVRAYKTVNGQKIYGAYSGVKKVKIKK